MRVIKPPVEMLLAWLYFMSHLSTIMSQGTEGYFNGSSAVTLYSTLNVHTRTSFSFRTCSFGQLVFQDGVDTDFIEFSLLPLGILQLRWRSGIRESLAQLGMNLNDNRWHDVDLIQNLGTITLSVDRTSIAVANSTRHRDLFDIRLVSSRPEVVVGRGFTGCILQGAGVVLNVSSIDSREVSWEKCPLPERSDCEDYQGNHCFSQPCSQYGKCISLQDGYHCLCPSRYVGRNCDRDLGPLCNMPNFNKCGNGGTCKEDKSRNSTSCICLPRYTGTNCETMIDNSFCDTQPCRNGGSCSMNSQRDNYICTCPHGFAGYDCELKIDKCQSSPCLNNGSCTDEIDSYTCDCTGTGYRGHNCEININECEENNPCYTGSVCFDRYGNYICECPPGFGGKNCDQEVNECDSNPCQNGGTCSDSPNGFLCHCVLGFAGINCETNIDDCAHSLCPNNTHCVDGINAFSCVCNVGYTGAIPHCTEINECDSNPCHNGGSCSDLLSDYICNCHYGFIGRFCEININECSPSPCNNGATCVDGIGNYTCNCVPGFTGFNCDTDINECEPSPCQNSLNCSNLVNDYTCECMLGWEGKNCDININECATTPCMNGQCVDLLHNFTCTCDPGYAGRLCEQNINECESRPCLNGGTCTDLIADFSCNCPLQFMGKNCSEIYNACHSTPCENGGRCATTVPSREFSCTCRPGYEGSRCENDINECADILCPSGQVCYDLENNFECRCPIGFSGPTCSTNIDECSSNPCMNGTCIDGIGTYACNCPSGLTGRNCEDDINECDSSPCVHGICKNSQGSFSCFCRPGFTGAMCNIDINECLSAPCQNNATCNDLINDYSCQCVPGFAGRNCEVNIDDCASSPCQNGGSCTDLINKYQCSCIAGFSGMNCEVNIDECATQPCSNGGKCIDLINGFECDCTDSGFSGLYCETNINDCASNPCQNDASCIDGIKDYQCRCHNGYEGKNCEVDIPDCLSSPCSNNGVCLENSNRTLYEINYMGSFPFFSYETAGGYRCVCSTGFNGSNCENNVDDCVDNLCSIHGECVDEINGYYCACLPGFEGQHCEQEVDECARFWPCLNGATCEDRVADYVCHCPSGYGDKECGTLLIGCDNNICRNDAVCKPYLSEGRHEYTCECPQGFHGTYCESMTTVSFNGNGSWNLHQQGHLDKYILNLYIRTTLPDGLIAYGNMPIYQFEYMLYLRDSQVNLVLSNGTGNIVELSSPPGQTDSNWKNIEVSFGNGVVSLNVSGHIESKLLSSNNPSTINFDTVIGSHGVMSNLPRLVHNFIGCIQDVVINDVAAIPDPSIHPMRDVERGCPRKDQCISSPCAHGVCKDNWSSYECLCSRPYFGKHCEYSHVPATFGYKNNTSSAEMVLPPSSPRDFSNAISVSFLLRTRKQEGLLFYLGSEANHPVYNAADIPNSSSNNFMVAQILDGKLHVLFKTPNGDPLELTVDKRLDDGDYHFIQIMKDQNRMLVKANKTSAVATIISDSPFQPRVLYMGGFPSLQRTKRQIVPMGNFLVSYSFENVTNFEGILQDFRINDLVVMFYPLNETGSDMTGPAIMGMATMYNTEPGVRSDDLCNPVNPCLRNAECNDIWNEYVCACPKGYRGKNCDEEEPCNNNSCPEKSTCHNLDVGYECVAPASFNGKDSFIQYNAQNVSPHISNISFSFRSQDAGTLLWLGSPNVFDPLQHFLQIELLNSSSLEVKWDFSNPPVAVKTVSKEIQNHGEWHDVEIIFQDNVVGLYVSSRSSNTSKDGKMPQLSEDNHLKPLGQVLYNSSNIYLGRMPIGGNIFKGCLDNLRFGGILLPFFPTATLPSTNNPFVIESSNVNIGIGCVLCWEEDCIHGSCEDPVDSYSCNCLSGYEGQYCAIDLCDSKNPCKNDGQCYHDRDEITCNCTSFYTGQNCTVRDKCASSPCKNGGICNHNLIMDDYECTCTDIYEGRNCEKTKIITCNNYPCKYGACLDADLHPYSKYKCNCYEGYRGTNCDEVEDLCQANTCHGHGNCSIIKTPHYARYQCHCDHGFTGLDCETNINECDPNPCGHGDCIDGIASFTCLCHPGYEGLTCSEKIHNCASVNRVCYNGVCQDNPDGYECLCESGFFGKHCRIRNECDSSKCNHRGDCIPSHDVTETHFLFNCTCHDGYGGEICTEKLTISGGDEDDTDLILMILIPVMTVFILCLLVGAVVFLRIAKKKRATRGTYSPSRQEMFGSRVEMNHVMKPPPEERLI